MCTNTAFSFLRIGNEFAVKQPQSPGHTFYRLQQMLSRKEDPTFTSTHRMGIYAKTKMDIEAARRRYHTKSDKSRPPQQ